MSPPNIFIKDIKAGLEHSPKYPPNLAERKIKVGIRILVQMGIKIRCAVGNKCQLSQRPPITANGIKFIMPATICLSFSSIKYILSNLKFSLLMAKESRQEYNTVNITPTKSKKINHRDCLVTSIFSRIRSLE